MTIYRKLSIVAIILLCIAFLLLTVFCFSKSYERLWEALQDLWVSLKFYAFELAGIPHATYPTIEDYSTVFPRGETFWEEYESFEEGLRAYFTALFSKENFKAFLVVVGGRGKKAVKVLAILLPLLLILFFVLKRIYAVSNTRHGKDTIPLKLFKQVTRICIRPIRLFVQDFYSAIIACKPLLISWIILWAVNLNLASILVAFFAFYLYFMITFRTESIFVQFNKLMIDLKVFFGAFPWWILLPAFLFFFSRWQKKLALGKLRHMEARNCGLINELPIVSMVCGSMGKKKTTVITDMALSQEVMFRQKAFELLQRNDMKFPHFPWLSFEMEIRRCMEHGTIYNLASVKEWMWKKTSRYWKHERADLQLYGYDTKRYGMQFNNGVDIEDLFSVMTTYAQLYFMYVINCSLLVSNYAIRTDNQLIDRGNFPMWAMDFFPELTVTHGRFSHILDFDVLRLGKKVIDNNPMTGSFEFGVLVISEIGKERGNVLDLKEMRKTEQTANQKNDLFNSWLKLCRHSATVDYFPFIKVFTDEQRPESWGADARDLCDIITIMNSSETKLTLPFYIFEDMIVDWLCSWFGGLYYDFRFNRGDNTLLIHILKTIVSWLSRRRTRIYNRYGYSVVNILKERGTRNGKPEKKKYFLMNKKIYSWRFSTDCFSDYFNDLALRSGHGLEDYPEYGDSKATVEELQMQNSYFIQALYRDSDGAEPAE